MNAIELMEKSFNDAKEAKRLEKEAKNFQLKAIETLFLSLGIEDGKTVFESPTGNKGVFCIIQNHSGWNIQFYRLKKNGEPSIKANYEDNRYISFSDAGLTYKKNDNMYTDKEGNLYSEGAATVKKLEYLISQYKNTGKSC